MLDKKLSTLYTIVLYGIIVAITSVPVWVLNEVVFK